MMAIEVCAPGAKRQTVGTVYFRDSGSRCRFNYTEHLDHLIRGWCARYPQLSHIDMDRVVLSVVKCRSASCRGTYANITSLRFPCGTAAVDKPGHIYRWPRILKNGQEALYLIRFYLPRFHNLSFEEKVSTLLHEIHHIDPKFNGELRSFGGRNWAHGSSVRTYEAIYASLKRDILKHADGVSELFLDCRFAALLNRFGDIYGDRYAGLAPYEDRMQVSSRA